MKIYYHEKEKILKLLKNPSREKRPVNFYLRNRDSVEVNSEQLNAINSVTNGDFKKIKSLFANKDTLYGFFKTYFENIKKLNNKRNRRK
jgi:hypothetical protein